MITEITKHIDMEHMEDKEYEIKIIYKKNFKGLQFACSSVSMQTAGDISLLISLSLR